MIRHSPPVGERASFRPGAVSVVVGHAMGDEGVPFGLDRPLDLLGGGDILAPLGMAMSPGIDHVPGLRGFVADACRTSFLAGGAFYAQPLLALLGDRGVGKGFAADWIARSAGLPLFRMKAGAGSVASSGREDLTNGRLPALPVLAMACSRCANPIISLELDADDPPDPETEDHIASMIDRRRNRRWIDDKRDSIFDLGHVSWILEVHAGTPREADRRPKRPATLPERLDVLVRDAGTVLELATMPEDEKLRRLEVATSICHAEGVRDPSIVAIVHDAVNEVAERPDGRPAHQSDLIAQAHRTLSALLPKGTG